MFAVIVADSGLPIFTERVGDAQPGRFNVAVKKVRTAPQSTRSSRA